MSDKAELAVEVVGASIANKATTAGAVTGVVSWLADANAIGLLGLGVAVLGLIANVYFSIRRDRRESAESAARIRALAGGTKSGE